MRTRSETILTYPQTRSETILTYPQRYKLLFNILTISENLNLVLNTNMHKAANFLPTDPKIDSSIQSNIYKSIHFTDYIQISGQKGVW